MPSTPISIVAAGNGRQTLVANALALKAVRAIALWFAADAVVSVQFGSFNTGTSTLTNITGVIPIVGTLNVGPFVIPERPLGFRGQQSWFDTLVGENLVVTLSNVAATVNIGGVLIYDTSSLSIS